MGSDWEHHTIIKPRRKRLTGDDNNTEYKKEFNKAFDIFLDECIIDTNIINDNIIKNNSYKIVINTNKDNDIIIKNNSYHVNFLKSKFINNKKFKSKLIEYYNPIGFFIKGPIQITDHIWEFEITKKLLMTTI